MAERDQETGTTDQDTSIPPSPGAGPRRRRPVARLARRPRRARIAHVPAPGVVTTRIELPWRTIAIVLGVVVGLWLLGRLWTQLLLLVVATFAAAVLDPVVTWLQRRGWPRGRAVGFLLVALIVVAALLLWLLLNPLLDQATNVVANLPAYLADFKGWLSGNPTLLAWLRAEVDRLSAQPSALFSRAVTVGSGLVGAVASLLIFITAMAYLLLESQNAFA